MKKVVYSVVKNLKNEQIKLTGVGYITDTDLLTVATSKDNKPYIRVYEDCRLMRYFKRFSTGDDLLEN